MELWNIIQKYALLPSDKRNRTKELTRVDENFCVKSAQMETNLK